MFGLELLQALLSAWDGREVFLSLVVLQSSGLGLFFPLFFFFGQILMMCHLPNSYLSLKEVVLSFEFLAERLRGGTRRLQEFLFGCLQHHVHYFCLWIPLWCSEVLWGASRGVAVESQCPEALGGLALLCSCINLLVWERFPQQLRAVFNWLLDKLCLDECAAHRILSLLT